MKKQTHKKLPFDIVYEDKGIIVVYKKSGVLSIAPNDGDLHNLYHYVREYVNKNHQKIFIVHRLDKDTSGLMVFAKSMEMKKVLQECFERREVIRRYEAVIKEKVELGKEIKVVQYLCFDHRSGKVFVTKDKKKGVEAITYLTSHNDYGEGTALDIEIKTGRQNQIRLAIHSLGLTLIGDEKYSQNNDNRMMLNAYELVFPKYIKMREHYFSLKPFWLK